MRRRCIVLFFDGNHVVKVPLACVADMEKREHSISLKINVKKVRSLTFVEDSGSWYAAIDLGEGAQRFNPGNIVVVTSLEQLRQSNIIESACREALSDALKLTHVSPHL